MALIMFDGFEIVPSIRNGGTATTGLLTVLGRDGIGKSFTGTGVGSMTIPLPAPSVGETVIGYGWYFVSGELASTNNGFQIKSDNGATTHLTIMTDITGHLVLRRGTTGGTVLAVGLDVMAVSAWHYVEVKCLIDSAVGTCVVKVDGITHINVGPGNTRNGGTLTSVSAVTPIYNGSGVRFDDLYVLDTTGGAPYNDWIGDRVVRGLRPTGPGSNTALTPSTAVANWTTVDEEPWSGSADYVSGTTGTDTYASTDVSGLTSIDAVQVVAYAMKMDTGTRNLRLVAYNGAALESPDRPLLTSGAVYQSQIMQIDPSAAVWTQASVNAAEFGVKVT